LQGFCVFTSDAVTGGRLNPLYAGGVPDQMVEDLYRAIHGPFPEGWHPEFSHNLVKAMPGSNEIVALPGDYHYLAGALLHSAQTGIPLVNDTPGLPVPLIDGPDGDKAKHLSAMLAIECVKLALPELPLLRPEDLMEFRAENSEALRVFRRSMLRYAADFNNKITSVVPEELQRDAQFFVSRRIDDSSSLNLWATFLDSIKTIIGKAFQAEIRATVWSD
jgi:hypothetical protein